MFASVIEAKLSSNHVFGFILVGRSPPSLTALVPCGDQNRSLPSGSADALGDAERQPKASANSCGEYGRQSPHRPIYSRQFVWRLGSLFSADRMEPERPDAKSRSLKPFQPTDMPLRSGAWRFRVDDELHRQNAAPTPHSESCRARPFLYNLCDPSDDRRRSSQTDQA